MTMIQPRVYTEKKTSTEHSETSNFKKQRSQQRKQSWNNQRRRKNQEYGIKQQSLVSNSTFRPRKMITRTT